MSKKCLGCGISMQTDNINQDGYIPLNKYETSNLCMRCFRLTHYGENKNVSLINSNEDIIDKINKDKLGCLFVVDYLGIYKEVMDLYSKINIKTLVINKMDVIPTNINKIRGYLKEAYKIDKVIFVSYKDKDSIDRLKEYVKEEYKDGVYVVGLSNTGKSTLINEITGGILTVSNSKNTTIDYVEVMDGDIKYIDAPGFILNSYEYKKNNKKIKCKTFQMKKGEVLLINDFYIRFNSRVNISIYMWDCYIKKYYKDDIDYKVSLNVSKKTIVIKDLGFISIRGESKIDISLDKELIELRESL